MGYKLLSYMGTQNAEDGSSLRAFVLGDNVSDLPRMMEEFPDCIPILLNADVPAWPVGSVFISTEETDPSKLLGFGEWKFLEKFGDSPMYAWIRLT